MDLALKVLVVEDSDHDVELAVAALRSAGFAPNWTQVTTEQAFLAELGKGPDIILSDYSLPQFNGLRAAQLLRASGLNIPFILISGMIGEDLAVEAMKYGATDYLLKDRISRLGSAVHRAMEQKYLREERERMGASLTLFRALVDRASDGIEVVDPATGRFLDVNETSCERLGYTREELLRMTVADVETPGVAFSSWPVMVEEIRRAGSKTVEGRQRRKDGSSYPVEIKVRYIKLDREYLIASVRDITDRRAAEKILQENEKKFSTVFQSSPIAMALTTVDDGFYLDANRECLRMLQRSRDEVIGRTSSELAVWVKSEERGQYVAKLREQGVVRNVEIEIRGKLGLITNALWSAETVEIGGRNCLLSSLLDITERKRAEEALRVSEGKFRKIFENVQDVFYQTDNEGTIIEISPSIERYAGYSREELLGQPVESVYFNPEDRITILNILSEKGEVVDYHLRLKTKDARVVYTSVNAHVLKNTAGLPAGVEGALRDITGRKLAEDELIQKTAFLEAQVDSALDGILVVDGSRKEILQNQRFSDLWKFPQHILASGDEIAKLRFAAGRTKNPREFAEKIIYLYEHPAEVSRDEIELVDGTILDRYSSPVRDKNGKYYGRIWAFRDITEQRKLELQFRQAQKMEAIGQLAGGVAHDFNNILAVIQLQASLLKLDPDLVQEHLDIATEIENASQRAANLTRQLLLFSQRQEMRKRDLDLNEVVTNIVKMLRRIVGEDVQMQFKLSPRPLWIHADAGMVDQILLNLTVNSRDAMPEGGQLVIETYSMIFDEFTVAKTSQARPGHFACLTVSDTGSGISPENMTRIFEPFFTTKEIGKGTGLGLATVFGIVKQHQGWINVYSEAGLGTTMRIYLPILDHSTGSDADRATVESLPQGRETILLVEDDAAVRSSVRRILSHLGYRILEATTGALALEVWDQHRAEISLLVTDLVMPDGVNGKELAAKLLKQDPRLKVVYVSGYSATVAGKDFPLEEGVNFLSKPFQTHRLAQTVRNCLDNR
jgi:PAS domain S-box-containing protein